MRAMLADLFGSYSMAATRPGTSSLLLLKSMIRYFRLWPPPICLVVIRPTLFLPPVFFLGTTRDFSGFFLVISSKEETLMKRLPADVGLYSRTAIMHLQRKEFCPSG